MKILLYSTYKCVVLEEIFYKGFKKELGDNNTFLYKPVDYEESNSQFKLPKRNTVNANDLRERFDDFDYVFFFNSAFLERDFVSLLNKPTQVNKVFVDGIDDFFIRRIYHHPEIKYYFKRELYSHMPPALYTLEWKIRYAYELIKFNRGGSNSGWFSKWNWPIGVADSNKFRRAYPIPVTVAKPELFRGRNNTKYDLFFLGHNNNPERTGYLKRLGTFLDQQDLKTHISTEVISEKEYIKGLKSAKVGLSLRGTGCDTYRRWEIPCSGVALLAQKIPNMIPNDFVDGESAIFFDSSKELNRKIERYIIKSDEWKEIAKNGQKHFFKYHTSEERVKELILKVIRSG